MIMNPVVEGPPAAPTTVELIKRYVSRNIYIPDDNKVYRFDRVLVCHPNTYSRMLAHAEWQEVWFAYRYVTLQNTAARLLRKWMRDQLFDPHSELYSPTLAAIGRDALCEACRGTKKIMVEITPKEDLFATPYTATVPQAKRNVTEIRCPECEGDHD